MLSPHEAQSYEQQSIRRTLCAGCTKELSPEETYACGECINEWLVYRDPNHFVVEDENE
ncbi:NinF family protein [Salmonella enterica subsp. enterica serovar Worthington]|uniref:NinF family protein n=1 Tax=Salmonella enterica TaxID=28901 RepID=A0A5T4MVM7_SALER|nr:NinF family protein [Salmonella enterica subsp. enterica serovar Worthington]EAT0336347.1 NinF family protein [Salmonella enterica]EAZ2654321.1 NinF family protein [Salmonella enterica]EBD0597489.1 NinF family protein [Salmonella enterica]EBE9189402.1 NinF family protein [Salmonella enterica]